MSFESLCVKVASPADLPADWHAKFVVLRDRYRASRICLNDESADQAAFEHTRAELWRSVNRSGDLQAPNNPPSARSEQERL